jgi:hypothetical protein
MPGNRGSSVPRGMAPSRSSRPLGFARRRKPARGLSIRRRKSPRVLTMAALGVAVLAGSAAGYWTLRDRPGSASPVEAGVSVPPPPESELPLGGQRLFPDFRVVAFYGAPHDRDLGILGIGPREAGTRLLRQADAYTFSSRRVLPAFELIGTLATDGPGDDAMYRWRLPEQEILPYLAEARRMRALFIIDIQPGRSDFMTEIRRFEELLKQPDVGLALDPEWHVGPRQVPGRDLGSVDAATINEVVDYLAELVRAYDLPEKLLVIHQFTEEMIVNKGRVETAPGVAVTFDIDGFGEPLPKRGKYESFSQQFEDRYFHGFKVFFEQDVDVMTPLEVLGLRPAPDLVVYQ